MSLKKILKYVLLLLLAGVIILIFLANRDLSKIYGGLTEKVDVSQFDIQQESFTVSKVNVFSADSAAFLPNRTVVVDEGKIISVDTLIPANIAGRNIDGTGKYLIPGLIDSHVHLFKSENDLLLYPANGITYIREMIGFEEHLGWRRAIEAGRLGPKMYLASLRTGSFGTMEGFFMEWSQAFKNVSTKEEAEDYVEEIKEQGYNAVKIYSHLNKECYDAINAKAAELDVDVVGHIPWACSMQDIYNSNQKEIAHAEEVMNAIRREFGGFEGADGVKRFLDYTDKRSKEIADTLISENIALTTTIWLAESFERQKMELDNVLKEIALEYENPGISEWTERVPGGLGWLPSVNRYKFSDDLTEEQKTGEMEFWYAYADACQIVLKNLAAAGVTILAGTDANLPPTVPGFSLHDELISLSKAGMTNAEVLISATAAPAAWFGAETGNIKPGYAADLVLLDKNPLEDIRNTKAINTVFLNGKILDRNYLDNILAAVKAANDASRTIDISEYQ